MKKIWYGLATVTAVVTILAVGVAARAVTQPSIEVYDPSDTAGPTLDSVVVSPTQADQNQTISITVTATDVSGVASTTASIKNSAGSVIAIIALYDDSKHNDGQSGDGVFANTWYTGPNPDDNYTVQIQSADVFGHPTIQSSAATIVIGAGASTSNTNTTNVNVNTNANTNTAPSDTTAPVINITAPAEGATVSTSSVDVYANATDPESTVTKVDFYLDSETTPRDTQNFDQPAGSHDYIWVLNVSTLSTGSHVLRAIATNGVGLTTTATRTINVTFTSSIPVVNITSPLSGTYDVGATINVSVHASDASDITRIELYTSRFGGPLASVDVTGTSDISVDRTLAITAGNIALNTVQISDLAVKWPRFHLPFISVAEAATSTTTNGNCTTTTTTNPKSIYAVAYNASQSGISAQVTYTVSSSSTSCTSTNTSTSSATAL